MPWALWFTLAALGSSPLPGDDLMCVPPPWLEAREYLWNKRAAAMAIGLYAADTLREKEAILQEGASFDDVTVTGAWARRLEREAVEAAAAAVSAPHRPRDTWALRRYFKDRYGDLRLHIIARAQEMVEAVGRAGLQGENHEDLATLRIRVAEARWQLRLAQEEFSEAERILEDTGGTCPD